MSVRGSVGESFVFRVAVAAAIGLATAVVGYAWVRVAEAAVFPRADPRAVVAVTQSGFFVRCAVALFSGGMGAIGGWVVGRAPLRAGRFLEVAVGVAIAALVLQAWVLP